MCVAYKAVILRSILNQNMINDYSFTRKCYTDIRKTTVVIMNTDIFARKQHFDKQTVLKDSFGKQTVLKFFT